jgi:hypothetical protein
MNKNKERVYAINALSLDTEFRRSGWDCSWHSGLVNGGWFWQYLCCYLNERKIRTFYLSDKHKLFLFSDLTPENLHKTEVHNCVKQLYDLAELIDELPKFQTQEYRDAVAYTKLEEQLEERERLNVDITNFKNLVGKLRAEKKISKKVSDKINRERNDLMKYISVKYPKYYR